MYNKNGINNKRIASIDINNGHPYIKDKFKKQIKENQVCDFL
jgi:hypothetical protein